MRLVVDSTGPLDLWVRVAPGYGLMSELAQEQLLRDLEIKTGRDHWTIENLQRLGVYTVKWEQGRGGYIHRIQTEVGLYYVSRQVDSDHGLGDERSPGAST
jgi:hypothetical protein